MGAVLSAVVHIMGAVKYVITNVIFPMAQILLYFMFIVLVLTFIANISGILGFFIFMIMFYYYVKGIIYIEPAYANNAIK
jgi:hypothetical protein